MEAFITLKKEKVSFVLEYLIVDADEKNAMVQRIDENCPKQKKLPIVADQ